MKEAGQQAVERRIVVADDLTGTLEIGAILKQAGWRVRIALGAAPAAVGDELLVVDSQTRRLAPEAALVRYGGILRGAGVAAGEVYLKVDSTLRGNVAAAIEAALAYYPGGSVVFCPAYPSQGRTVEGGQVLVYGEAPRARTLADESAEPVVGGVIREVLGGGAREVAGCAGVAEFLEAGVGGVVYCDARTEEDLRGIWQAVEDSGAPVVMAGSAGLLAARYVRQAGVGVAGLAGRRWIVACGSMNPASQRQLAECSWTVFRRPATASAAAEYLAVHGVVVLATPAERAEGDVTGWLVSMVQGIGADGLIVFGGDTAASILAAHGVCGLEAAGEILPGVPCSWAEMRGVRTALITKAGGFGGPGLLRQLISEITK